ncbi:hypothetical protein FV222_01040 [Methylobacterium sp. WL103]|nr:hypothetical protein FV222_01040 [Methylobacterium sp. WL103]
MERETVPAGPTTVTGAEVPGIVASGAYADGRRIADIRIDEAGEWARRPDHVVWIRLYQPSVELLVQVQQFGLHRLAIEDAWHAHQRPKIERYGDCIFVVVRTAQLVDGRIALGQTQIFVGRGFVVTVRHRASTSYTSVREKTESCPKQLAHGEDYSRKIHKRIEEGFGWIRTVGGLRKVRFMGRDKVGWTFALTAAAYNLVRLPKLLGPLA